MLRTLGVWTALLIVAGCSGGGKAGPAERSAPVTTTADSPTRTASTVPPATLPPTEGQPPPLSPTTDVSPSIEPLPLIGTGVALDATYDYDGQPRTVQEFLARSHTLGFLAVHRSEVVAEQYAPGSDRSTRFNSWSVGKSITAAAVGIAVADGDIRSIDEPVTRYVPDLTGSAYDGVPIRDVLEMSSGSDWDEDSYTDPNVGATAMIVRMLEGTALTSQARESTRGFTPGTEFNYNTMDTYVLGWVVENATGERLADVIQDRIWQPAGMESTMQLGEDLHGNAVAGCCYYATLRDYARFGLLYLNDGRAQRRQVVPASWVAESTHSDVDFLQPGRLYPDYPFGYGFQWWLGDGGVGDYAAIGIRGQFIYVNPTDQVVIVKASEDPGYDGNEGEALSAFRALSAQIADEH